MRRNYWVPQLLCRGNPLAATGTDRAAIRTAAYSFIRLPISQVRHTIDGAFRSHKPPTNRRFAWWVRARRQWLMPELTRRRYPEAREECWHVYYGDVHAGTLAIRTGNPHDNEPWEWRCGFYPGSHPSECSSGTSASFEGSARRIRRRVAGVPVEVDRGRLSGLARPARLDRAEVRTMGRRQEA